MKWYVDQHHAAGKHVSFAPFTRSYYSTDDLADLLEGLRKAFTDMRRMKALKDAEAEYGIDGWIGALEITDGANRWHPHLDVLFFHRDFLGIEYGDNADLRAAFHETFSYQIDRHLSRQVHHVHGVDLVPVKTETQDGAHQGQDVASIDAAVWNDARHIITPATGSLIAAALTAMENHGPQGMADLLSRHLEHVEVVTHPETGLPHLRYSHRA